MEKIRVLIERQLQLREQTKSLPENEAPATEMVERQAAIQTEIAQLHEYIPEQAKAAAHIQQAETAVLESATSLLESKADAAIVGQGRVLGNLSALEQLLKDQVSTVSRDQSADELFRTIQALADIRSALIIGPEKKQPSEAAGEPHKTELSDTIGDIPINVQRLAQTARMPDSVTTVLSEIATAANEQLSDAAVNRSEIKALLQRTATTVEIALADARRRHAAIKIGELARSAEVLERAAAEQQSIARDTASLTQTPTNETSPKTSELAARQSIVRLVQEKLITVLASIAPVAAAEIGQKSVTVDGSRDAATGFSEAAKQVRFEITATASTLAEQSAVRARQLSDLRIAVEQSRDRLPTTNHIDQLDDARQKLNEAIQNQALRTRPTCRRHRIRCSRRSTISNRCSRHGGRNGRRDRVECRISTSGHNASGGRRRVNSYRDRPHSTPDTRRSRATPQPYRRIRQIVARSGTARRPSRRNTHWMAIISLPVPHEWSYVWLSTRLWSWPRRISKPHWVTRPNRCPTEPLSMPQRSLLPMPRRRPIPVESTYVRTSRGLGPLSRRRINHWWLATLTRRPNRLGRWRNCSQHANGWTARFNSLWWNKLASCASTARDNSSLAKLVQQVEPASASALEVAVQVLTDDSQHRISLRHLQTASSQADLAFEHAVADLEAEEQAIRRDLAIAESIATVVQNQQTATETIAGRAAELERMSADSKTEFPVAAQRTAAHKMNDARQQFSESQRSLGQAAVEISGQTEVANTPLREALEWAANFTPDDFSIALPDGMARWTEALDRDTGEPQSNESKRTNQPMATSDSDSTAEETAPGEQSSTRMSSAAKNPHAMGTGFISQSPDLTAEMMAGSDALQACA